MGNYNVDAAYTLFGGLKHRAHRALTYMARRALDPPGLDGQEPLMYFGGHAELAAALGLVPFGTPWKSVSKSHKNHVREVVNELKEAGAVGLVSGGHNASAAEYRLNLLPTLLASAQDPQNGGPVGPPERGSQDPRNGGSRTPKPGVPRGGGGSRTREEENNSPDPAISPAAVDNSDDEPIDAETANRQLVDRHGLEHALQLLDEHATTCACDRPAAHLLQPPTLRVLPGGAA